MRKFHRILRNLYASADDAVQPGLRDRPFYEPGILGLILDTDNSQHVVRQVGE